MTDFLTIDFETRSFVNLQSKSTNAWIYSEHESADIICMAYKINDSEVVSWRPGQYLPDEFVNFKGYIIAHNALFEYAIIHNIGLPRYGFPRSMLDTNRYICTAALCRANAFPASLDGVSKYLKLDQKKTDLGKALIKKYCVPQKRKGSGELYFNDLFSGMFDDDAASMVQYNNQDVETTWQLFNTLRGSINTKVERRIFLHDLLVNTRGMLIDRQALDVLINAFNITETRAHEDEKSLKINTASNPQFIQYLNNHGVKVDNAQQSTLTEARQKAVKTARSKETLDERIKAFDIRDFLSRVSLKKVLSVDNLVSHDNKLRYFLKYHGARTGRYTGSGFQPHNMPKSKSTYEKIEQAITRLKTPDYAYNKISDDIKAVIPGLIVPREDNVFLIGDFAAIEARVLAWVAGESKLIKLFKADQDVYKDMAGTIYCKAPADITATERNLGKGAVLGCGYGMGHSKFLVICLNQGVNISPELSKKAVNSYRSHYSAIPGYWKGIERYFKARIGKKASYVLPSGRELIYRDLRLDGNELVYTDPASGQDVHLWGGTITENVCQAIARDILCDRMLACESARLPVVFHTHDEIVCESSLDNAEHNSLLFNDIMNTPPKWLSGFPLKTEIEISRRYHK